MGIKDKFKVLENPNTKRYLLLLAITMLFLILYSFTTKNFVSFLTVTNLIRQSSVLAIMAMGMTFVILTGGIDLSVGSNIALSGVCAALVINAFSNNYVLGAFLGMGTAIAVSTLIGVLNGFMIGYWEVNAFMATLGMMSIARGLTLYITNGSRIVVDNDLFNYLGAALISFGKTVQIPAMIFMVVPIVVFSSLMLSKGSFGTKTYAVGGNAQSARASGINVRLQLLKIYSFMGLICGLGTILTIGRSASAQPLAANGFEFDVITAVVLGGVSLMGGIGSTIGTIFGTVLLSVLFMGINMIDIPIYFTNIVKGVFILISVFLNSDMMINLNFHKNKHTSDVRTKNISNMQVLKLNHVSKTFPGVKALSDVTFEIKRGTVHALVGENGAGKSTLVKILSGVYQMDEGEILVDEEPVVIRSPQDSQRMGISVIYQELALIQELNVTQNIFLGRELKGKGAFFLNSPEMRKRAEALLSKFGLHFEMDTKIGELTVSKQQMVEIVKTIGRGASIIVMDEPTSSISEQDKEELFSVIRVLKQEGVAIVYISHRMQEVFDIADEVTVLRDGCNIVTLPIEEVDEEKLIKYMVDRELGDIFFREGTERGDEILRVEGLGRKGIFHDINFSVYAGEVVGMAGLVGAGRTEVARCLFGLDKYDTGKIFVKGKQIVPKNPKHAMSMGICYVSENRRDEGIIPQMTVRDNISIALIDALSKLGWINRKNQKEISDYYIKKLLIKTPSDCQIIGNLSGGNQQKCCLAKMLVKSPRLIILDEPTRGIDIGAKAEIHRLIDELAKQGIAILIISSEMPEIIGASDRIVILSEGTQAGIISDTNSVTQEEILTMATSAV